MRVRTRLLLAFTVVGSVLVLPAAWAVQRLDDLRELAVEDRARHASATAAIGEIQTASAAVERRLLSYVGDPAGREDALALLELSLDRARVGGRRLAASGYAEEAAPLRRQIARLEEAVLGVPELVEAGRLDSATVQARTIYPLVASISREVGEVANAIEARAGEDFVRAEAISQAARETIAVAVVLTIALAAALALWTTWDLAGPLERLRAAMTEVARTDRFDAPADLPYDRRDEIGGLAASFRTMTRRLDELDRLKAEFMGVAGHELKTPINVIRSYAQLMEEELAPELNEDHTELLRRMGSQTDAMSRMVSRLMDISRLETGNFGMQPEPVLLRDLLDGVERNFRRVAEERGIDLVVTREAAAPRKLEVDLDLIRDEVLGNLVSNALKFTPPGGEVQVRARRAEDELEIRVSDTGPGIPEEHRPYIFERYYRVERTRGIGTGLGLAICRQVAEAHGGRVWVDEETGRGATFVLRLPTREADEA